jgi:hypothetical protein
MRTQILDYLTANLTGTIKPSQELPWEEGGNPLYLKNARRVYLDEPYVEQDELVATLDETDINQNITHIRGYLSVDAKSRNADLDSALATLATARTITTISNAFRREFDYTSSIQDDRVVYELDYRFYALA